MVSIDGDIYSMDTGGTLTKRFEGTDGTVWNFEDMEKTPNLPQLWMLNGTDKPKKWDGVTFTDWAGEPPNGTMARVWKNIMVIGGHPLWPQRLFFSKIGDPEAPAKETANGGYGDRFVDIRTSADDVQPLQWLEVLGDSLLIFKKNVIFRMFDSTTFSFQRVSSVGCEGRFQTCIALERCYFFHRSGVYSISEDGNLIFESRRIEPIFNSTSDQFPINQTLLSKVRMASTPDRKVMIAMPTSASEGNNLVIEGVLDLKEDEIPWIPHELPAASLAIYRQAEKDELVGGDSGKAKLLRFFAGANDDGLPIESEIFSSWRKFLSEEPLERLRRFNCHVEGAVTAEIYGDLDSDSALDAKRLEPEVDQPLEWDDGAQWDDGLPWNPQTEDLFQRVRPETRSRYHAVRFLNTELDKTWTISMAEFAFRGGKEHTD